MPDIFIGREPVPERIVVRGVDYTREVVQVLERRQAGDLQRADRELKAAHRAGGERRTINGKNGGGGEVTHVIHPVHAAMMVNKFGDAQCLSDPGITKDYLKQFPAAKVRSRSQRIQVGWRGGSSKWGKNITFRKVY
jgi:hypothetical protein